MSRCILLVSAIMRDVNTRLFSYRIFGNLSDIGDAGLIQIDSGMN